MIVARECPVEFAVLTGPAPNRPALPMPSPSFVTVHEVGNLSPGADENMHRDFVRNGGGTHNVSFHFVVGPTKAIQLIYLNENAWHASDYYGGTGNRDSIAIETIQIGDFNRTVQHLAWLIAELFRNPGRFQYRPDVPVMDDLDPAKALERIKQHNYWAPDKKNCPQFIRQRGLWVPLLEAVRTELARTAKPVKQYAPPVLPSWWNDETINDGTDREIDGHKAFYLHRQYEALKRTRCAASSADGAPATRAPLAVREKVDGRYVFKDAKNRQWIVTRYGTRLRASSLTPAVTVRNR